MGIGVRHDLVGTLRRRVQAQRMTDRVILGQGHLLAQAIDAARRGVDQVAGLFVTSELENRRKTLDIGMDIGAGVFDAVANARLRREVDDRVAAVFSVEAA